MALDRECEHRYTISVFTSGGRNALGRLPGRRKDGPDGHRNRTEEKKDGKEDSAKEQGGRGRQRDAGFPPRTENDRGPDRKTVRRRGDYALGGPPSGANRRNLDRQPVAGHGAGRPRNPPRPRGRDLRARVERQNHPGPACGGRSATRRRDRRVRRRRARFGPNLGQEAGRQARDPPGQPAGQR